LGGPPNQIYVDAPPGPSYDEGPRYYDDSPGYEIDEGGPSGGFPGEPPPPRGGGRRRKRSIFWRMRRILFVAGLTVMALVAAGVAVIANAELPDARVLVQSSLICAADVPPEQCTAQNAMAMLSEAGDRENVKLAEVPDILVDAIIDSEDAGFREHKGLNPVAISRALYWDVRSGTAVQGGSTITQQYVKNRFLNSEQTLTRKLKEAVLAVKLEQSMSKDEILEGYLNTIFFGRNAYGIQAASRAYFNKDVSEITELRQVAYLAGLIRAPNRADASTSPEAAKDRRTKVLVSMLAAGTITQKQYDDTVDLPFDYVIPADSAKSTLQMGDKGGAYITEYVKSAIKNNPEKYHLTDQDVQLGGLRVYTTIDPRLQTAAWDSLFNPAVNSDYPLDQPDMPQGAMVSIDDQGNVRAMVGGRGDGTGTNFAVRGHGSDGRAVGSTFKPIVLATAVDLGYSLESTVSAKKKDNVPGIPECDPWTMHNAGESEYPGERIDLVTATKASVNTAYAHLIYELAHANGDSTEVVTNMAEKLGMDVSGVNKCLPMVLGSNNSSPMEMAEMYSTFANRGVHKEPRVISRIEKVAQDGSSKLVYESSVKSDRALGEAEADVITHTLQQALTEGTGKRAFFGKDAAGKTGTTADNKDAWFVGYTPKLTTAVWMGFEKAGSPAWVNPECQADARSGKSQQELEDEFSPYAKYAGNPDACPNELAKMGSNDGIPVYDFGTITGGSIPAHIWKTYMQIATDGMNDTFVEPSEEALRAGTRLDEGEFISNPDDDDSTTTTTLPGQTPTTGGPGPTFSIPEPPDFPTTTSTTDPSQSTTTSTICWPPNRPECAGEDGGGG
jgi:membrane peptidoglycan carboxypeptidase